MAAGLRILIVRFSSLGDVILTTPLVRALRRGLPGATITFVTKRGYAPVLAGNPYVDRIATLAPGEPVRALAGRLLGSGFDHMLDLHQSLRSRWLRRYLPGRWSGYDQRRAARWRLLWFGGHDAPSGVPVAERYFAAARALSVAPDGEPAQVFPSEADRATARAIAPASFVALLPGARHRTKRWPPAHWRVLADALAARGIRLVALGNDAERRMLEGPGVTAAYGQPLGITAALLERARVAVCNDSGLMHLASAVGTPVVTLFGPTVRAFGFAPYRAPAIVLERPLGCRPCSSSGSAFCPLGHHRCLAGLEPGVVAARVLEAA